MMPFMQKIQNKNLCFLYYLLFNSPLLVHNKNNSWWRISISFSIHLLLVYLFMEVRTNVAELIYLTILILFYQ